MPDKLQHIAPETNEGMQAGGRISLVLKRSLTWENCPELRKKLENKIQEGHREIILHFNKVDLMDSAALELIIDMHDTLTSQGGALKIVGLNEVCRDILLSTRIINILFVYKDINEAISHKRA